MRHGESSPTTWPDRRDARRVRGVSVCACIIYSSPLWGSEAVEALWGIPPTQNANPSVVVTCHMGASGVVLDSGPVEWTVRLSASIKCAEAKLCSDLG